MEHYLSVVRECMETGVRPRCHLEDITRSDIYGFVIPFCLELMKLMEEYQIPDYQADVCVAFAQGNVGKAIQLASSDDFNEMKASALQLIKRLDDIDLYEMTAAVKQIADYKLEINDYFDLMMIWYRDVLYFKATGDVNGLIFKDEVYDIKRQAEKSSYNGINSILEALRKAQIRLDANVNFDLVIELLLLTIKEN